MQNTFKIVSRLMPSDLTQLLSSNMASIVGTKHPSLQHIAKYYTQSEGKMIRPILVLLMSRATAYAPNTKGSDIDNSSRSIINTSISPQHFLNDNNPSFLNLKEGQSLQDILPSQLRLAEIIELIHTASLLHDDVIDNATIRRSKPSTNVAHGDKLSILAGDFLLGRASVMLARLRDPEVIELIATIIANLVEGEFMQLRNTKFGDTIRAIKNNLFSTATPANYIDASIANNGTLKYYLEKTYLKTASLMAKSCRAATLLRGCSEDVADLAYEYGRNLGLSFQIVDDLLDFGSKTSGIGKEAGVDLKLGLATAPVLYAAEEFPELNGMIKRRFSEPGDVENARNFVERSKGVEKARKLAQGFSDRALDAIRQLPESEARSALEYMSIEMVQRTK